MVGALTGAAIIGTTVPMIASRLAFLMMGVQLLYFFLASAEFPSFRPFFAEFYQPHTTTFWTF